MFSQDPLRHDWAAIRAYYESGRTLKQCRARFGFSSRAWTSAVNRGEVVPRRGGSGRDPTVTASAVAALLANGVSRSEIARRLAISKSTVTYHASRLGYGTARVRRYDWAELQRYCDGHDNRLENLQLLCPNCHSQTENFAGRNASRTGNGAADAIL